MDSKKGDRIQGTIVIKTIYSWDNAAPTREGKNWWDIFHSHEVCTFEA